MGMDNDTELDLQEYVEVDNTELGEACGYLLEASRYGYCYSNKFNKAVKREIKRQLKNYENNSQIVESTETRVATFRELEWKQ